MPAVYIIRHAQAGPRHDYDTLSGLGRDQARRLGRHPAREGVRFRAVFRGCLQRRILTTRAVEQSCRETLRVSREEIRLFTFNGVPHLSDAKQRSFR